ncbi:hypothetical protein VB264_22885 [Arcicella aquatica]|uniref:Lipoprotein n=1 Tax=Arcicella aquatica TaxID=217141 RepID=A0ABU5QU84_9BACT|nr:hypothetical protein [Arcicella aquatica]MEA5260662.1 hypothetical protein [Arcicella aquatica]
MKKTHYFFLIMLLLGASGCWSHLKVQVSVLKSDYLNEPEVIKNQLIRFANNGNSSEEQYKQLGIDLKKQFSETISKLDSQQFPQVTKNSLDSTFNSNVDKRIDIIIKYHNNFIDLLYPHDPSKQAIYSEKVNNYTNLTKAFIAYNDIKKAIIDLKNEVQNSINELRNLTKDTKDENQVKENTDAILAKTINRFSDIYDDPLASVIANAPSEYWKASTNKAKATTLIGNADIAILMNDEGSYSIKGVRNDASQATKAIFSVTNIAIQSLSKAYGVGFSLSSTPNDTTNNYFKQSYQVQYDLDKYVLKTKAAKIAVMQSIIDEENILSNSQAIKTKADSTKYFNAIHNIQNTIKLHKQLLIKQ